MAQSKKSLRLLDDAEYAKEHAVLERLQHELAAKEQEYSELDASIHERLTADSAGFLGAVRAKIEGKEQPIGTINSDRELLGKIRHEISVIRAAIEEQRRALHTARRHASVRIAESVRPEYMAAINNMDKALLAWRQAHLEYKSLATRLNDEDVAWGSTLRPMAWFDMNVEESIDRWRNEAKEYKLIS